jgi:hypothetical protein
MKKFCYVLLSLLTVAVITFCNSSVMATPVAHSIDGINFNVDKNPIQRNGQTVVEIAKVNLSLSVWGNSNPFNDRIYAMVTQRIAGRVIVIFKGKSLDVLNYCGLKQPTDIEDGIFVSPVGWKPTTEITSLKGWTLNQCKAPTVPSRP